MNVPLTQPITQLTAVLDTVNFPQSHVVNGSTLPFVVGSIGSVVNGGDYIYATTTDRVIRMPNNGTGKVGDYEVFEISSIYVANIDLLVVDSVNEVAILFGTPGGESRYAFFYLDTFLPAANPQNFPGISGGIVDHIVLSATEFIVIAGNSVTHFQINGLGAISGTVYNDPNLQFLSAAYDSSEDILYLGMAKGTILALNISSDDFSQASPLYNITLEFDESVDTTPTGVTVLFVDERSSSHYLYAATQGESGNSATLHRVDLSASVRIPDEDYWRFGQFDVNVNSGLFNAEEGLMYLLVRSSPGRIVQIDLPSFKWEATVRAAFDGPNEFSRGIYNGRELWIAGSALNSFATQMNIYFAAEGCLSNCFGNGVCEDRYCTCDIYISALGNELIYQQPWCETRSCDFDCSGNAVACVDGNCTCFANFTGAYCETQRCPNDCISEDFGICNEETLTCECLPGHDGDDCSDTIDLPCPMYETCGECQKALACGWCATTGQCLWGNPVTPYDVPSCPSWHKNTCPSGIFIAAIILLVVLGLLLLVNMLSYAFLYTAGDDSASVSNFVKHEWYSLQRANKWWVAVDQVQLIASIIFLHLGLPTILTTFTTWFQWVIFAPGTSFMWGERSPANQSYYNTIESPAAIYLSYSGLEFESIGLSVLITWVIAMGGVTILFSLIMIIAAAVRGGEIVLIVTTKPVYILLRMIDMAIFPFALFGGISLVNFAQGGVGSVMGVVMFVIAALYLLGVVVYFLLIQIQDNKKALFSDGAKGRCLFMYGHLKNDSFGMAFWNPLRKFLLGFLIGVFHNYSAVAQILSIVFITIIYVVFIWVLDYHADMYQKFCETGVGVCNVIAYAVLLGLLGSIDGNLGNGVGSTVVSVIYIAVKALSIGICLTMFFFNWFQKEGAFSPAQVIGLCLCKDTSADN